MADDKDNVGGQDRAPVASQQQYEVAYFMEKHGLSRDEAMQIIKDAGPSREKADAAAKALGGKSR